MSTYPIYSVCFSPNGKWLAAGGGTIYKIDKVRPPWGGNGELKIWEVGSWKLRTSLREGFTGMVETVKFTSPDVVMALSGKYLPYGKGSPYLGAYFRFYDAAKQQELPSIFLKLINVHPAIDYEPTHDLLAFYAMSLGKAAIYDAKTLKKKVELQKEPGNLQFAPDGKTLISFSKSYQGSIDNEPPFLHLYDTKSGKLVASIDPQFTPIYHAAFSPNGQMVAVLTTGGKLHLLQTDLKTLTRTIDTGYLTSNYPSYGLAFAPDSRSIAIKTGYDKCTLYDVQTGAAIRSFDGQSKFGINCLAFSPDGSMLAVGSRGSPVGKQDRGLLRVWEVKTGKTLKELP